VPGFGHNTGVLANSLLITGASQILTLRGRGPRRGAALSNLGIIKNGAMLIRDDRIVAVGVRAKVEALPEARTADNLYVGGRVLLPGFVDSHTHLVHAASRAEEYELKIAGASYEEIARKGGGILNSVKKLRAATSEALKKRALAALRLFAANGTTTLEAKSGYGLDVTSELKILGLHQELQSAQPLEIVSTFLGAHVVPAEYRGTPGGPQRYVSMLINRLISFSLIISLGFLLMVSLLLNTVVDALSKQLLKLMPGRGVYVVDVVNNCLMFMLVSLLFGIIFKVLPDARIKWKDVMVGAVTTAVLFMIGKFCIGFYLGHSNLGNIYGTAGSIIIVMLWVYYSAVILYFGAEFTKVYAKHFGGKILPNDYAVWIKTKEIEVPAGG